MDEDPARRFTEVINPAYEATTRVENISDENAYELIGPSTLQQNDKGRHENQKVSVTPKNSNKSVTISIAIISALVMAALALIMAVIAVSYTILEMSNQQAKLSSSSEELQYQLNRLNQTNHILQTQLEDLSQQFSSLTGRPNTSQECTRMFYAQNHDSLNISASSCSDHITQDRLSGEYWVLNSTGSPVQVYCDMNRTSCSCNTTEGWMRVANLDMTDPNQKCPDGFRLVTRKKRPLHTCGRPDDGFTGCISATYPTHGVEYSQVCGKINAYQYGQPKAKSPFLFNTSRTIDDAYADGVSLTHGRSPRQHIWTFIVAINDSSSGDAMLYCPCGSNIEIPSAKAKLPSFVSQDYFCDLVIAKFSMPTFHPDDPLWDSQGCGGTSTCCEFNDPPWFCKQLPQPTTDDIELRICGDVGIDDEDVQLERVEIFVK